MKISKEARIGISSVVILFILYWGVNFLKGSNILSSLNTYTTQYASVDGLEVSSPVVINGMKVGTVTRVDMRDVRGEVVVDFAVKDAYKIPTNSIVELTSQSLLGGMQLVIIVGDANTYLEDGATVESRVDNGLEDATKEVTARAYSLMDTLTLSLTKINALMSEDMIADVKSTISNLNNSTATLSDIMESEKKNINEMLANLTSLTNELNEIMPATKRTLDNVESLSDSLTNKLPEMINSVNDIVTKLNSDEGVINKLMTDKELYDNATSTLEAATKLLEDLKANPKRYVHISVFGGGKDK